MHFSLFLRTAIEIFLSDVKPHNGNIWCNTATDYIYVVKSSIILFINSSSFLRSFVYEISIQFQHCRLSSALYLYDIHFFSFHVCMPYSNPWIIPSTDTLHCICFLNWEFIDLFFPLPRFLQFYFLICCWWWWWWWRWKREENNNHLVSSRYCFTYFTTTLINAFLIKSLQIDWSTRLEKNVSLNWLTYLCYWMNLLEILLKIMLWTCGKEIR